MSEQGDGPTGSQSSGQSSGQASGQPSGQPGRYNRSFEGLVGAMIVIVLVVVGFVVYRGLFSDPQERRVESVDYLTDVRQLQESGFEAVYPATLPEGWRATEVRVVDPGEDPGLALNFFTDDDDFVGVRQVDEDVDDLLAASGVDDADEADPLEGVGDLAPTWAGWSDPDGDHAYSAEVGDRTVVVYGSVPAARLADLVGRLTRAPVPTPSGSATPGPATATD